MSLAAGARLDSYEIIAPLGAGGMGEVYRARDTVLKRDVAIKVLPDYWSRDRERLHRFELEAQAAAALTHPNIVSIHHVGRFDGSPYIVTELLRGETLRERLRHGPMRVREAIDVGIEITLGLAAAHDAGIVHRDLKPENIFLTKDGRTKILDFGLAKLQLSKVASADSPTASFQQPTSPGHVLGTVGYMSPEQVRGQPADARSDIFAAGTVLYEMLTGKCAFHKATSAETMSAILNEDPPPVSQVTPNLPPGLQRIVNRCLAKNPKQRFQHASDLAFALEAISETSSSMSVILEKAPASRWPWIAVAVAVLAVAGATAIWWRTPPAVPVVESIKQLTDDGEPKFEPLATDGSRVYFTEGTTGSSRLAQVSVTGGRTALIDDRAEDAWLQGISPDGSALLAILNMEGLKIEARAWSIPVPAGEPRQLGNMAVSRATYFPDGRLLLVKGKSIFVADKEGLNPRQLFARTNYSLGDYWSPSVSPDGNRILVTTGSSLTELFADGSAPPRVLGRDMVGAVWSHDGKYVIYGTPNPQGSDLWALPISTGWFRPSAKPTRLTTGAVFFIGAVPSHDGNQIFTVGNKPRSEMIRYDPKTHQFQPFLNGISAISPTFSADGQWMEYTSYPDHTLWRSRSDGTDRKQLTFAPLEVGYPNISYDGRKVAFTGQGNQIYVVSMEGGTPERIVDSHCTAALWSPDGNQLVLTCWREKADGVIAWYLKLYDSRTRQFTELPDAEGMVGGAWVTQSTIVASNQDEADFSIFDLRTQKWEHLISGHFVNWAVTRDGKYLIFTTSGIEPTLQRLRFADRQVESLTSLKGLRRVVDPVEIQTQVTVDAKGSPILARDIGTKEVYALTVKWP